MNGEPEALTGEDWDKDLAEYAANPTIENYLLIRRLYPKREPTGWWFSGIDPLHAVSPELERWEISTGDVAASMDADQAAIERVSLRLLELLADKGKRAANNETHLARRGEAIPDQLVDYLICIMLEGMAEYDEPKSIGALNFLIRERLGGPEKALHSAFEKRQKKLAIVAICASARRIPGFAEPSLRQAAEMLGIDVSSASRLFEPGEREAMIAAEVKRSESSGPLIDPGEVEQSEYFRALHRKVRDQQP